MHLADSGLHENVSSKGFVSLQRLRNNRFGFREMFVLEGNNLVGGHFCISVWLSAQQIATKDR